MLAQYILILSSVSDKIVRSTITTLLAIIFINLSFFTILENWFNNSILNIELVKKIVLLQK